MLVPEHCVHSPIRGPSVWQAGVGAAQSASLVQPEQVWDDIWQMGVIPEQSLCMRQPTQVSSAGLHTGVGAMQSLFVRHATQAPISGPEVAQRGVPEKPAQSVFEAQGPQTLVVVLQMGVLPEQSALVLQD